MVDAVPSSLFTLPSARTRLIGRESERASAQAYLLEETVPLLTLTGPGGVGKTRLALQVSADVSPAFTDGVVFVPLASVSDPEHVVSVIGRTLHVRESAGSSPLETLAEALRDRHLLLVLDNLEQLLPAGCALAQLLQTCPHLQILATSRTRLHLDLEQVYPVFPLPTPDLTAAATSDALLANPAVAMFIERCRQVSPHLELGSAHASTVAAIVRRLDGLPLAIELAAARTPVLSPDALLTRLDHRLPLLTSGPANAPSRHRTMRSAIAWSYDILSPETQRLFRQLAVFASGCDLQAADAVADADDDLLDGIGLLVASSLMQTDVDDLGTVRYSMLETLREFGLEQVHAAGELHEARARHASYFLALVEHAFPDPPMPGEVQRIAAIRPDYDNICLALDWFATNQQGVELARLTGALFDFWYAKGRYREGRSWLHQALGCDCLPRPVRLRALGAAGALALIAGDLEEATRMSAEEFPLARAHGDAFRLVSALFNAARLATKEERYDAAEQWMQEAYDLTRGWSDSQASTSISGVALGNLGLIALAQGQFDRALSLFDQAITVLRELDYGWALTDALCALGGIHLRQGHYRQAAVAYADALAHAQRTRDPRPLTAILLGVAGVATAAGLLETGAQLLGIAESGAARLHAPFLVTDIAIRDQVVARMAEHHDTRTLTQMRERYTTVTAAQAADIAAAVLRDVLEREFPKSPQGAGLTRREREILRWLDRGWTDQQIAEELFLSRKTISNHVSSILFKFGAQSRQEAV